MRTPLLLPFAAAFLACAPSPADTVGTAVTLELRLDAAGPARLFPVASPWGTRKAYAEAVKGERYRLVAHNNLDRRVGVVLAVDGRNIITGEKSWLGCGERMYILDPGQTCEFAGWRTAQDRENRFYFTTPADSYAGAFGDESAMGVVAMAVYPEWAEPPVRIPELFRKRSFLPEAGRSAGSPPPPPAPSCDQAQKAMPRAAERQGPAGTGYGEEIFAPSVTVAFRPETRAREKAFIKYEWRETLIRLGVIPGRPGNRLWDADGFAPPPPRLSHRPEPWRDGR